MPNCPKCEKPVYFGHDLADLEVDSEVDFSPNASQLSSLAERKTSLGKDWHGACLKCERCNKTLVPGQHAEHEGKPYCNNPCYSALFGPGGFGRGGAESYVYKK